MHEGCTEQCSFRKKKKFDPFSFYREGIFFFLFARTRFSRVNGKRCTVIHRFKVEVWKILEFHEFK